MKRSSKLELAHRINRAFSLLAQHQSSQQIIEQLKEEFCVSPIQAYRYVQQAKKNRGLLPVPEATRVVTTKLSYRLVDQLKAVSVQKGLPMTQILTQALETYLKTKGNGQKKEGQDS